jgi:Methyltransferase domain
MSSYDISAVSMKELVEDAWTLRSEFDLSNVAYGKVHWGDMKQIVTTPFSYYFFLAGIARLTQARRIVEVGTHQGGSTRALASGFVDPENSRLVTFDVTDHGARMFKGHQSIRAYTLDANSEAAFGACLREFGEPRIDLAFIDSTHDFWTTLRSFSLYAATLECRVVVLDDITLNESMAHLWELLRKRYGKGNTIAATEVDPAIRVGDGTRVGFGIVRIPTIESRRDTLSWTH